MNRRARVLVVDDEPNIVLSLEFLLQREGYEVAVARDGTQALAMAAAAPPDLVILDLMLPDVDGFEVCRRLREAAPARDLAIVLLTARGRDAERQRGIEEGADAYVTKPFSTRDLIALVRRCLERPRA
jgi:DNA-binding response OmpR family regulator